MKAPKVVPTALFDQKAEAKYNVSASGASTIEQSQQFTPEEMALYKKIRNVKIKQLATKYISVTCILQKIYCLRTRIVCVIFWFWHILISWHAFAPKVQ